MSGGSNEGSRGLSSDSSSTLAAVALVVVATVVPSVGAAIASPTGSTVGGSASTAIQVLPDLRNESEDGTPDSVRRTPTTTGRPNSTTNRTTNGTTNGTTNETTRPGEGNGPPDDTPGSNRTPTDPPNRDPRPEGPPNGTEPPGQGDGSSTNQTPGRDRLPNRTRRANDSAPSANRTGPPNGVAHRGRSDVSRVNVTVENATANETVSVNVSHSDAQGNVSFSSIDVTPTRNASFTLNVTASDDPIAGETPTVGLSNGTRPLAYLSVDHSIADENVSNVTFTFRVERDRVNASERDEIALYRFHGGSWNELPTKLVTTTETHYVYRVRSPGLSEFAAGKQTAQFDITNASVEITTLSVGDALKVRVRVTNHGKADGTFTAKLVLGNRPVARRHLTIASGGMRQTTFERTVVEPGTYEVYVNDFRVGEVTVNGNPTADDGSSESPSSGDTDRETADRDGTNADGSTHGANAGIPGFGFAVAFGSLLAGLLAILRQRR